MKKDEVVASLCFVLYWIIAAFSSVYIVKYPSFPLPIDGPSPEPILAIIWPIYWLYKFIWIVIQ